jgi:hypothetical protein
VTLELFESAVRASLLSAGADTVTVVHTARRIGVLVAIRGQQYEQSFEVLTEQPIEVGLIRLRLMETVEEFSRKVLSGVES